MLNKKECKLLELQNIQTWHPKKVVDRQTYERTDKQSAPITGLAFAKMSR